MTKKTQPNGALPKIDHDVPMPDIGTRNSGLAELLRSMQVGDSFALDASRAATARTLFLRFAPRKFATRKQEDGTVRFWRIA
jgi:hypothetical protein